MENRLYVAFYGQNPPPRVKWRHETIKQIETYKIFRSDYSAEAGSEKVIVAGMDGAIIRNWITIQDAGQGPITKNLGVDYYNPMPTVIERGMKPVAAQGDDPPWAYWRVAAFLNQPADRPALIYKTDVHIQIF